MKREDPSTWVGPRPADDLHGDPMNARSSFGWHCRKIGGEGRRGRSGRSALYPESEIYRPGWPRIWANSKALIGIFSRTAGSTCKFGSTL
jgi:hypothetical protein